MRMKILLVLLFSLLAMSVQAAVTNISVLPNGDGIAGKDRWGYGSWESTGFDVNPNTNSTLHWYEYGDGQWRNTYLQFSLASFGGSAVDIVSATFNFNLLSTSSNPVDYRSTAGKLYHASNASIATGEASQMISGNEYVGDVQVGAPLGWNSFDVTSLIQSDVSNGYAWSVFSFNYAGYAGMNFSSGEDADYAPFLSITTSSQAVPLPGAIVLMGSGIIGLLGVRRRLSSQ